MSEYRFITNDNIVKCLEHLDKADEIGIDTETTGFNVRNKIDWCQGICLATEQLRCYIPFRHQSDNVSWQYLDRLVKILSEKDLDWHNMKFDYHSLATLGVDPLKFKGLQYDTLLIAMLVNEELPSKELDWLSKIFLKDQKHDNDIIHKLGEIYGWGRIPARAIGEYGAYDADLTRRLKSVLWPKLAVQELSSVYWDTELPFSKLLYKMEAAGVGVDKAHASKRAEHGDARMGTIRKRLHFNPASPTDLQDFLLKKLELPVLGHTGSCVPCKKGRKYYDHEGKPSFRKEIMEQYDEILQESNDPTAKLIAEYRGWQKAVSALYLPLLEKTGPDGRIRTQFKQHGTVTGRTSATDPNLQQIPRGSNKPWNGDAKFCFNSGYPDYTLIGWDYSQLELRLAAAYGPEPILLTEFEREGADPFNVLAPLIFGGHCKPFDRHSGCYECEKQGHDTKTFTYANLYGAGLPKIAATLGRPEPEVKELYDRYKNSIRNVIAVSQQISQLVEARGYVKYWDGRRRHMRDRNESYKAWNSVIQGGGAQLVKKAMLRCDEFCDDDCRIVLTVHDEITFIIRDAAIEHFRPKIVEAMTDWPLFNVKFAVDSKVWQKPKEIAA